MVSFLTALQCPLDGLWKQLADCPERVIVGILHCSHGVFYRSLSDELRERLRDQNTTAANV